MAMHPSRGSLVGLGRNSRRDPETLETVWVSPGGFDVTDQRQPPSRGDQWTTLRRDSCHDGMCCCLGAMGTWHCC